MRIQSCLAGLLLLVCLGQPALAQQSLNIALFERYLVLLREQLAIPGLSGALVEGGRVVWTGGFGHAELSASVPARPDTPYPLLGLTQTISSTLLLQQCGDYGHLEVADRIRRWVPEHADEVVTIRQVLSHTAGGGYVFDSNRFEVIGEVFDQCANADYRALLTDQILERFSMVDAIPGGDLLAPDSPSRRLFSASQLNHYDGLRGRIAAPYRVDAAGRATASAYLHGPLGASSGLIGSAMDLASFDLALRDGLLLTPGTLATAWSPVGGGPSGLGWLVQRVGNDTIVWQFGVAANAYSSLMIKVPGRDLTLILLANSDRLAASYTQASPDVTASLFAQIFFRIFLV